MPCDTKSTMDKTMAVQSRQRRAECTRHHQLLQAIEAYCRDSITTEEQKEEFTMRHLQALTQGVWRTKPYRFLPRWSAAKARQLRQAVDGRVKVCTSLVPGAGMGLFAVQELPKNYVLPYFGAVYPVMADFKGNNEYAMWDGSVGALNGNPRIYRRNLAAMINEPGVPDNVRPGRRWKHRARMANTAMREGADPEWNDITPMVVHTTRVISAGEELYLYYGKEYVRTYDSALDSDTDCTDLDSDTDYISETDSDMT